MAANRNETEYIKDATCLAEDIKILLDCLKYQKACVSSQRQALLTLANMCEATDGARDLFRECGCLDYVSELVLSTHSVEVQLSCLFTLGCAVEGNFLSQMRLCSEKIVVLLTQLLESSSTCILTESSVVYLAINLLNSNAKGQNMAREKKLLANLLNLYRTHIPSKPAVYDDTNRDIDLFINISRLLCVATDNPQNETNQCLCSAVLPVCVSLLSTEYPIIVLRAAVIFLTSCVTNNLMTQRRLHMVGGLKALFMLLRRLVQCCHDNDSALSLAVQIVRAIFVAVVGNGTNKEYMAVLNIIPLLLKMLKLNSLDTYNQLNIILCLETLVDQNEKHQQDLLENDGIPLLISVMADSRNDMLNKTVTLVLQTCMMKCHVLDSSQLKSKSITTDIPDSPTALMPQQVLHARMCDTGDADAIEELNTKRLSTVDKVHEWLKCVDQQQPKLYSLSNIKQLLTNAAPVACVEDMFQAVKDFEKEHKINSPQVISTAASTTAHTKIEALEIMLLQEREKRERLEQQFQNVCLQSKTNQHLSQDHTVIPSVVQKENTSTSVAQATTGNSTIAILNPKAPPSSRTITSFKKHHNSIKVTPARTPVVTSIVGKSTLHSTQHQLISKDFSSACYTPQLITRPGCSSVSIASHLQPYCKKHAAQTSTLQHDTTLQPTPQVINKQSTIYHTPEGTAPLTSCKHPAKLSSRFDSHHVPQQADIKTTAASKCSGCMPQERGGLLLNSRVFLPVISIDTHTCRYHKKLAESMLYKRPMVLNEDHSSTSKDQAESKVALCQSETPLVYKSLHNSPVISYNIVDLTLTADESLQAKDTLQNMTMNDVQSAFNHMSPSASIVTDTTCVQCRVVQQSDSRRPLTDISSNVQHAEHGVGSPMYKPSDMYSFSTPKGLLEQKQAKLPQHLLKKRSRNLYFTKEEEAYVIKGVKMFGTRWKRILEAFPFQNGRTATSLKDKYKLLVH